MFLVFWCLYLSVDITIGLKSSSSSGAGTIFTEGLKVENEFACAKKLIEHDTSYANTCATLTPRCGENERIEIINIRRGVKSTTNITCSKAVDECKKPLTGCCSITKDDSEETLTLQEKVPFFEQCNGKRSCSIDSPGMLTNNLQSADYIWLEYSCVKDSKTVSFCEDMDVEFDNDTLASVIYTATTELTDAKQDCHCNITSKRDHTIRLNIVDVRLTNQNGTCSPTRLRIFDTIYMVCRESSSFITGFTMWYDESLTIDLELFTSDPPQMVWVSVSGLDGPVRISCSSKLLTNISDSVTPKTGETVSNDCSVCCPSLAVLIAVPLAVVAIVALVLIGFLLRKRCIAIYNKTSSPAIQETRGVQENPPLYLTLDPEPFDDATLSNQSSDSITVHKSKPFGHTNTSTVNTATESNDRNGIVSNKNEQKPRTSHYERISIESLKAEPSMKYVNSSQTSGIPEAGEYVNDSHDVKQIQPKPKVTDVGEYVNDKDITQFQQNCNMGFERGENVSDPDYLAMAQQNPSMAIDAEEYLAGPHDIIDHEMRENPCRDRGIVRTSYDKLSFTRPPMPVLSTYGNLPQIHAIQEE